MTYSMSFCGHAASVSCCVKVLQRCSRVRAGEGRGLRGLPSTHVGKLLLIKSLVVTSGSGMADKSLFTVTKVSLD